MSAIAEVKQLIETALASVEDEIDNEVVQVVKSKLVDLQSFLSTVVDDAGEQLDPVAPADPNASLNPPAAPVGPVAPSEPATPEAPVDPTTAPEVPTPPTDEVTPPADGSDPVTNEAGEQVTDPNAPR